ncbi:hypothetical protein KDAU_07930 [Dictyobacter aurantiacus]|uniref:Uncharacterized protein n=1 Tax=Dictyobacter aurantiacus TaxID=1936993 RepID=A0A401Z9B8_9CHLR|nr:hypothetical protein KDAU_07930 [Dictyobacter aurantiacus]
MQAGSEKQGTGRIMGTIDQRLILFEMVRMNLFLVMKSVNPINNSMKSLHPLFHLMAFDTLFQLEFGLCSFMNVDHSCMKHGGVPHRRDQE